MNKQIIADMMVLTNAIARVRELHTKVITLCSICEEAYPCATIRALDGEQ